MKRKREKYAEYLVKCKAEAMISLKGSQERTSQETNQKRNKGVKQNRTSLTIENRQRKESSALQNENVLNNQHLPRKKLQGQQAKQQQKERHCQNNSENLQLLKHKNGPASSETGKTQETGLWKPGTILVVGDSMLNGVEERKMPSYVKVRNFPGSTVRDMYDYVKPLLRKRPSHVILNVGTNDAVNSDCSTIVNQLINIKEHIESELPDSMVTLSLPIMRADNTKADKILAAVRNALKKTSIDTLNNEFSAPKNYPRETPFIDNSLAIKRTNGDVVSKFLWRSRESIAEIRLNGDRPSGTLGPVTHRRRRESSTNAYLCTRREDVDTSKYESKTKNHFFVCVLQYSNLHKDFILSTNEVSKLHQMC